MIMKNIKLLRSYALLCVHASRDTLSPFTIVRTHTLRDRETIIYVYHNAVMTVVIPNVCLTSTATRKCSP